jgi:hypothetical protein
VRLISQEQYYKKGPFVVEILYSWYPALLLMDFSTFPPAVGKMLWWSETSTGVPKVFY